MKFPSMGCLMGSFHSQLEYSPIVETNNGSIRGKVCHTVEDKVIDSYLGIPYAKPPVGELRFKKPEPPGSWTEVRDCVKYGHRCPQTDQYFAQYLNVVNKSEDCLTLNVLAPRWKVPEMKSGLPVMVYVHGGGFAVHTSSLYCGTSVARNLCVKDVIYVSINYRLGVFGFFRTEDDECKGNLGLWDQTLALKWVKDNIAGFGGDPDNITIFGQSAGGASVDLLSLSPHSRDLFNRVIAMAGTGECDFAMRTKEHQALMSREFARYLGWKGEDNDTKGLMEWLNEQDSSTLEVGLSPKKGFRHSLAGNIYFVPNYDGDFFPKPISELRKEAPKKSIMTGTTEHEGLFFGLFRGVFDRSVAVGGFETSIEGIKKFTKVIIKECDFGEDTQTVRDDILHFYTKDVDPKDKHTIVRKFIEYLGDCSINGGVFNYASKMAQYGHDVYLYSFDYHNPDGFGVFRFLLPFKGATHCSEIRYILGKGVFAKFSPNADDLQMIEKMTTYFSNFAKYGNPNGPNEEIWEPHDSLKPGRHLKIELQKQQMVENYLHERMDFWNSRVNPKNKTKSRI